MAVKKLEAQEIIGAMQKKQILIIGDMVADIYLDGRISRISREAPVLVLEQAGEKVIAGGAANVVNNIATLGGTAYAVGILGRDGAADGLRHIFMKNGVRMEGLFGDENRPTTTKTRIIAGGRATVSQQIVRIDRTCSDPLSETMEMELLRAISNILPHVDGVVISDYGAGTVTPKIQQKIIEYCKENRIPSIVDSRYDVVRFKGIGYVKQNDAELSAAIGHDLVDEPSIVQAAQNLIEQLACDGVLVTRGEKGMILVQKTGDVHNIPVTDKSEVFDVSGAGDTCVAAMILALAGGIAPKIAACTSNFASGIAVRKLGTATVSASELRAAILKRREREN